MQIKPLISIHSLHIHLAAPATEPLPCTLESASAPTLGFAERFSLSADGTLATDHNTGLMWPVYESESAMNFDNLQKYVAAFRVGGFDDWFIPSDEQRLSITDRARHTPALAGPLKSRSNSWEWIRTPYLPAGNTAAGVPAAFWQVSGHFGALSRGSRHCKAFARPCRFVARAGQ